MHSCLKRPFHAAIAALFLLTLSGVPASAATTVKVTLFDDGGITNPPTAMGMGQGADMSKATMHVVADKQKVPAGDVTFEASNTSKDVVHEMIVAKVDPTKPLPYNTAEELVDEDTAGVLGEVSELEPGMSGSLSLNLAPGTYVLFCNVPGHYASGMWTLLTVI